MTITSQQILQPPRIASSADMKIPKPPPKVFPIDDFPFKGYQPPKPEGYERSKDSPDTSAIVIDNGMS